ncbi:MAG TPA: NAD(P)/FAD-dependent oxidoreductase [Sporichthyaceae bacterium]|nr:NAD(P)/FAD-dependent oxidoreductase [Sporichthyaceae bacterium]
MNGDRSHPDRPEVAGAAENAVLAARTPRLDLLSAALEGCLAVRRRVAVTGHIVHAFLLLAVRIWLSQAIFVHQLMMMMRAEGFAEAPSAGATLIQSIAPLLLATGLATRPVALILVLGVGQSLAGTHLAGPQAILLIWLLLGGAGPVSVDYLLRGGLVRVPVWAVRAISRLYAWSDACGDFVLPFGTRLYLALAIAGGTGFAMWPVPVTGELVTAPWPLLLLCWALLLGLATRPVALLLCALAPPIVLSGVAPDRFEVTLLLLLLAAKGAGWLSLDSAAVQCAGSGPRVRDHAAAEAVPHVVVVGGGFGGIAAVRALRSTACRITLIDRRNHYLFQPLLYQVATAALSPADIAIPIRSILRDQRNVAVRLGEVVGVDRIANQVHLPEERIPFDYLILATGARHSYFGRDEWAAHAPGLKSIEDATTMRSRMLLAFERAESEENPTEREAWLTFVVVGGGPTGVELAGALAEVARTGLDREYRSIDPATTRVILVQSAPRVLPAFSPALSAHAERSLRELGVEVRTAAKVTHIDQNGIAIDGSHIAARTTFWAAGVAASAAAKWLGQAGDKSGRVLVDDNLGVVGSPRIFAIGDTAASNGWAGAGVPGLAPAAKQQGRHAANVIRAAIKGYPAPGVFRYRHYGNLATIGRLAAVVELRRLRLWGAPAWWLWGLAHVLLLAGGRNRAAVVMNWLWAYLTYRRGTRLITGSTMDG